jgi:HAD superfamily hydrolase (TIGR01484 family)
VSTPAPCLLCTDLDRTLLPNGSAPESPGARERFAALAARPEVTLAYVTGRHRALIEEAMAVYRLPVPDYVIGDVGTRIWEVAGGRWRALDDWAEAIAADWAGLEHRQLAELFADLSCLRLQEPDKQGPSKLSWYAPGDTDVATLLPAMRRRLDPLGIRAALIWSQDETSGTGLLDLLPERATKLHAIERLIARGGFEPSRCVFSGDSGNDLPVLASPLPAVLVANATEAVRAEALRAAAEQGHQDRLYLARGGLLGMNGNYAAGILEGLAHYLPEAAGWIR